jgi:hypothetical protein
MGSFFSGTRDYDPADLIACNNGGDRIELSPSLQGYYCLILWHLKSTITACILQGLDVLGGLELPRWLF